MDPIDRPLGAGDAAEAAPPDSTMDRAVRAGLVERPEPFIDVAPRLSLPGSTSTTDLLDRDDRMSARST